MIYMQLPSSIFLSYIPSNSVNMERKTGWSPVCRKVQGNMGRVPKTSSLEDTSICLLAAAKVRPPVFAIAVWTSLSFFFFFFWHVMHLHRSMRPIEAQSEKHDIYVCILTEIIWNECEFLLRSIILWKLFWILNISWFLHFHSNPMGFLEFS